MLPISQLLQEVLEKRLYTLYDQEREAQNQLCGASCDVSRYQALIEEVDQIESELAERAVLGVDI